MSKFYTYPGKYEYPVDFKPGEPVEVWFKGADSPDRYLAGWGFIIGRKTDCIQVKFITYLEDNDVVSPYDSQPFWEENGFHPRALVRLAPEQFILEIE